MAFKANYIKNFERYEGIIKKPYIVGDVKVYEVSFLGLNELYNFLVSNPSVNDYCFQILRSQGRMNTKDDEQLYELSYEDALNFLLGGYEKNIDKLLELKRSLETTKKYSVNKTKVVRSFTGSRISINGFISNSPKKFYRLDRIEEKKFIKINSNISFSMDNDVNQVLHRGVLLKNLVDLLEANNYSVALNTFILLKKSNERFCLKLCLKEINSSLNIQDIIFPLTSIAFFRRLIFRVMESVPFENQEWGNNYGSEVYEDEAKSLLNLSSRDIFVGTPSQIGLTGKSLYQDANKFLEYVNIDNYVRVMKK